MTAADVEKRLDEIAAAQRDDEAAHALEDRLYEDVIQAIARDECDDPRQCAAIALRSKILAFGRWCA